MNKITRFDLPSISAEKESRVAVNIPEKLSIELGQISLDRQKIGIKGYTRRVQLIESIVLFVESNEILKQLGRTDIPQFTRMATESFALAMERYAKVKGIPVSEVKPENVANWLSDLAVEHGGLPKEE